MDKAKGSELAAWGWEEALMRLEKLRIRDDGDKIRSQISEEQIRDNQRRQEDELLALEAIYQDNLLVLDKQDDLLLFQIFVHCDVTEGIKVSAKFHSGTTNSTGTSTNSDEGFLYSFEVRFLPPIVLTCMLPKSYPSNQSPYFTISTKWLNGSKISSICTMLDSIWREQLGQEVIFQWTEWLLSSSLSYLDFDEKLVLSIPDLEHIIPFMINYNEERCHEDFLNNLHQCVICFSEYLGSEFIKLPCKHLFCTNCMETYSRMHVKEGSVTNLTCPSTKCGAHVPPMLLKRLLDHQDYERWESLLLQKTLDAMSDVVYCPRCGTPCLEDSKMNDAQCSKCSFSFCTLCKERRHVGEECMDSEMKLRVMKEKIKTGVMTEEYLCKERELKDEVLSMKEVLRISKQCPKCKIAISRTEGCNKMVCSNCGQFFCYRCNKRINGYDHFESACELFSQEVERVEAARYEERLNARQMEAQMQAQVYGALGHVSHPCPNCRQGNPKVGNNNHLFCWACQTRYCALCHKAVRRFSEHFTPKGCQQHSDDP